ncbi:hypothetical protein WEN_02385 [Mycoplasma wenyonii str. Massachusetts]|uniref:Uncharacterized protein n=1 Tax=Mycoplasma wenyonii (strain Massachusetts) TaxID=1197325 RepID=I6YLW1_MYCWM|nr:hypothetical protein [Mycoplasma wenyonii]AFN65264.1 hypothetical protein WEN_02385 [Mycoplasma wenyonii str. Massachusetts]
MGAGGVVSVVALPTLSSYGIIGQTRGEKISYEDTQKFEKYCSIIAKESNKSRAILICQKESSGQETSFYLFTKEGGREYYDEIQKIETPYYFAATLTFVGVSNQMREKTAAFTLREKQENWKGTIASVSLEGKCTAKWTTSGHEKQRVDCMTDSGGSANLGDFEKFSSSKITTTS